MYFMGMASSKTKADELSGDRGFALIAVLLMGLVVGGILIALQLQTSQLAQEAANHEDEIVLDACLSAGLNRMVFAYAAQDDALRPNLVPDGRIVPWSFAGKTLLLSVRAESGKWDLNVGDRSHIAILVDRMFPKQAAHVMSEIDAVRSARKRLTSVAAVLEPWDRMTERRTLFERYFTVATDQNGVDPMTAPVETMLAFPEISAFQAAELIRAREANAGLPNGLTAAVTRYFAAEKPIYTFRAEASQGFRRRGAIEALVSFSEQRNFSIYSWTRTGVDPDTPSETQREPPTTAVLSLP